MSIYTKEYITTLFLMYSQNNITPYDCFELAWEDIHRVSPDSSISPIAQTRIRASNLAFSFVYLWLELNKL